MHLILLLIIVIILLVILARVGSKRTDIEEVRKDLSAINAQLTELTRKISSLQSPTAATEKKETPTVLKPEPVKQVQQPTPVITEEIPVVKEKAQQIPQLIKQAEQISSAIKQEEKKIEEVHQSVYEVKEGWFEKWLRNNPDIEKFIGENLINKIGIAILVLGIAFFVKYAIDQNWINEVGRVGIGFLCGIILIGIGHRLRNNYRSFSSVLVGGALAIFYFTAAFAFHQYGLISQTAAFIIMVVITAFAVILSVLYNRLELAVLATVGGFITPFLVSTGEGNYIVLFTYLCILNAGLIVLAFYKRWYALNYIAFVFTVLIYGGWIIGEYSSKIFSYAGTFVFGTVFYFMFLTMSIIHAVKKPVKLNAADFSLLLIVNLAYYAAGIFLLLHEKMEQFKGLFTVSLGLINLVLAYVFFKRKYIDRNFIFLLIGLTLTFISLAAPVQLKGNYITLFWSAETVLLFWLYQRSFIKLLKIASVLLTVLTLCSLLMDWSNIYGSNETVVTVITNKGFITTLFTSCCMIVLSALFRKEANTFYEQGITNNLVRNFYILLSVALCYLSGALEIYYQFTHRYVNTGLNYIYLQLYTTAFIIALFLLLNRLRFTIPVYIRLGLPALVFFMYVLNTPGVYITEKLLLEQKELSLHFLAHLWAIILLLLLIFITIKFVISGREAFANSVNTFSWITVIGIVIVLSVEIRILYIWLTYRDQASIKYYETLYSKAGLSIVWGICSFVLIWLGLHYRLRALRIIALSLFGITLVKLFAYDITNISPGGKIAAFILLGALLLIVSFMYQRLKKLIIDDVDKKN